jgi:hypothetical protein
MKGPPNWLLLTLLIAVAVFCAYFVGTPRFGLPW